MTIENHNFLDPYFSKVSSILFSCGFSDETSVLIDATTHVKKITIISLLRNVVGSNNSL